MGEGFQPLAGLDSFLRGSRIVCAKPSLGRLFNSLEATIQYHECSKGKVYQFVFSVLFQHKAALDT